MNIPRPDEDDAFVTLDPLEVVERVLSAENLAYDRTDEGDLAFTLTGDWQDYELWFAWRPEADCLQLCLSMDMKIAKPLRGTAHELVNLINQRVWLGHFETWADEGEVDKDEKFDLDFALMTGELALFLTDLVKLLGGEKAGAA